MRIKINGRDIDHGSRVTIETSDYSNWHAIVVIIAGLLSVLWVMAL